MSGSGSTRTKAHGLTAEINQKIRANYDTHREQEAREWITALTQIEFTDPPGWDNFHKALKDGQTLCKLVNAIKPKSVRKINTGKMVFHQHENINNFVEACKNFGVDSADLFQTVDLYDNKNMTQVVTSIFRLGSAVQKLPEMEGRATLGPKTADQNKRNFSKEVLDEGKKHSSLFTAGSNKGATQAGSTSFGTQRKL